MVRPYHGDFKLCALLTQTVEVQQGGELSNKLVSARIGTGSCTSGTTQSKPAYHLEGGQMKWGLEKEGGHTHSSRMFLFLINEL